MTTKEWMSDFIATRPKEQVEQLVGIVLLELFSRQTEAEKVGEHTMIYNSVGFTAFDSKSGTMDSKSLVEHGKLSAGRVGRWTKKNAKGVPRICKYHGQVSQEDLEARLVTTSSPTKLGSARDTQDDQHDESARNEYRRIRSLFYAASNYKPADFDALVKAIVPPGSSAAMWVEQAKATLVPCRRCAGTGQYVTGTLNGKPTGPGGICFRCEGKGAQTHADAKRNWGYDRNPRISS